MLSHFAAVSLALLSGETSTLQNVAIEARPITTGLSSRIGVLTTAPILKTCGSYTREGSCFRVSFKIIPKELGEFKVGYFAVDSPWIYETTAYSATGALCKAHAIAGLPFGVVPGSNVDSAQFMWVQEPYVVTTDKPAIFVVEFACDDTLVAGDNVTMQMSLVVDPGRRVQFVRYAVPEMVIRARR